MYSVKATGASMYSAASSCLAGGHGHNSAGWHTWQRRSSPASCKVIGPAPLRAGGAEVGEHSTPAPTRKVIPLGTNRPRPRSHRSSQVMYGTTDPILP